MAYLRCLGFGFACSLIASCGGRSSLNDELLLNARLTGAGGFVTSNTGGANHAGGTWTTGTYGGAPDASTGGAAGCIAQTTSIEFRIPGGAAFEFMVDVGDSMLLTSPSTGGVSKWKATQKVLKEFIELMPNELFAGISFFSKPGAC